MLLPSLLPSSMGVKSGGRTGSIDPGGPYDGQGRNDASGCTAPTSSSTFWRPNLPVPVKSLSTAYSALPQPFRCLLPELLPGRP